MEEDIKHTVKLCQCTFAQYLDRFANKDEEDDNKELSSDKQTSTSLKEDES